MDLLEDFLLCFVCVNGVYDRLGEWVAAVGVDVWKWSPNLHGAMEYWRLCLRVEYSSSFLLLPACLLDFQCLYHGYFNQQGLLSSSHAGIDSIENTTFWFKRLFWMGHIASGVLVSSFYVCTSNTKSLRIAFFLNCFLFSRGLFPILFSSGFSFCSEEWFWFHLKSMFAVLLRFAFCIVPKCLWSLWYKFCLHYSGILTP